MLSRSPPFEPRRRPPSCCWNGLATGNPGQRNGQSVQRTGNTQSLCVHVAHRRFQGRVSHDLLDGARVGAPFRLWVAKLWRNSCGRTQMPSWCRACLMARCFVLTTIRDCAGNPASGFANNRRPCFDNERRKETEEIMQSNQTGEKSKLRHYPV
jgi:hypothetical protein